VIVARVRRTIVERALIGPDMRVLAACSGGPDSGAMLVVLARLAAELGFLLEAASVDHGLRAAAAADVEVARRQADAVGVVFHALKVQVPGSGSLQAGARVARYDALLGLAAHIGAERVAVGHTQDDQAETVMLRLLRGAGLPGLAGIEPARGDGVIRPLIDCRRSEVAAFALQHCPEISHDPSNLDRRFGRSRLRVDVLPVLEREDAAIVPHLADVADDARAVSLVLRTQAAELLGLSIQAGDIIDVSSWHSVPTAIRRWALRLWLARSTGREPGRAQLAEIERATGARGEVWLFDGWKVQSAGLGQLRLVRKDMSHPPP
jgi:tRNA(Ile)-lysidine synthase